MSVHKITRTSLWTQRRPRKKSFFRIMKKIDPGYKPYFFGRHNRMIFDSRYGVSVHAIKIAHRLKKLV